MIIIVLLYHNTNNKESLNKKLICFFRIFLKYKT